MPVEIEAKMPVTDFTAIRRALAASSAEQVGEVLETNTFFDTAERSLLTKDSGLRLRTNNHSDGRRTYIITFKGPLASGELKSRDEFELAVDDPNSAVELLARLGYVRDLSFEKRRESWTLDDCQVELDELPYLGKFVEIEGPSEPAVLLARKRLGLSNLPLIKQGYIALLSEYLKSHSITERQITFASLNA